LKLATITTLKTNKSMSGETRWIGQIQGSDVE
jgi:hypothetical protein